MTGNQDADQPQDGLGEIAEEQAEEAIEPGVERGEHDGHGQPPFYGRIEEPVDAIQDEVQDGQGIIKTPSRLTKAWLSAARRASRPATMEARMPVEVVPMLAPSTTAAPTHSVTMPPAASVKTSANMADEL